MRGIINNKSLVGNENNNNIFTGYIEENKGMKILRSMPVRSAVM